MCPVMRVNRTQWSRTPSLRSCLLQSLSGGLGILSAQTKIQCGLQGAASLRRLAPRQVDQAQMKLELAHLGISRDCGLKHRDSRAVQSLLVVDPPQRVVYVRIIRLRRLCFLSQLQSIGQCLSVVGVEPCQVGQRRIEIRVNSQSLLISLPGPTQITDVF